MKYEIRNRRYYTATNTIMDLVSINEETGIVRLIATYHDEDEAVLARNLRQEYEDEPMLKTRYFKEEGLIG